METKYEKESEEEKRANNRVQAAVSSPQFHEHVTTYARGMNDRDGTALTVITKSEFQAKLNAFSASLNPGKREQYVVSMDGGGCHYATVDLYSSDGAKKQCICLDAYSGGRLLGEDLAKLAADKTNNFEVFTAETNSATGATQGKSLQADYTSCWLFALDFGRQLHDSPPDALYATLARTASAAHTTDSVRRLNYEQLPPQFVRNAQSCTFLDAYQRQASASLPTEFVNYVERGKRLMESATASPVIQNRSTVTQVFAPLEEHVLIMKPKNMSERVMLEQEYGRQRQVLVGEERDELSKIVVDQADHLQRAASPPRASSPLSSAMRQSQKNHGNEQQDVASQRPPRAPRLANDGTLSQGVVDPSRSVVHPVNATGGATLRTPTPLPMAANSQPRDRRQPSPVHSQQSEVRASRDVSRRAPIAQHSGQRAVSSSASERRVVWQMSSANEPSPHKPVTMPLHMQRLLERQRLEQMQKSLNNIHGTERRSEATHQKPPDPTTNHSM